MRYFVLVVVAATYGSAAHAVPRMSLPAGSPCATCHLNSSGGGGRTNVGWESIHSVGAIETNLFGGNTFADGHVSAGFDMRIQFVHLGRPRQVVNDAGTVEVVDPEFKAIPMQLQPELGIKATDWLRFTAHYNPGPNTFSDGIICDPVFPGQSCYEATAVLKLRPDLELRTGMFQPAIGIRPDDHTVYVRADAYNIRKPIIAPNYADPGAELTYHPISWFRVDAGGVYPQNLDIALNETTQTADLWPAVYSARVTFLPRWDFESQPGGSDDGGDDDFDDFDDPPAPVEPPVSLNTWFGGSILGSGDFYFLTGFAGGGFNNGLEMRLEVSHSARTVDYTTLNGTIAASWAFIDWLVPAIRVDRAQTDIEDETYRSWQYVFGFEFFPLPFVEIRPEYRIVKTDEYLLAQPTVQLHLFY
ncbi:MAG: hypothetical protein VX589_02335 [Myxococcota bacterium]|nr:hypothetical protein [Myxococcota bacterium]